MKNRLTSKIHGIVCLFLMLIPVIVTGNNKNEPSALLTSVQYKKLVTPDPLIEAKAVYRYLKDITGEKILSGQMCVPWGIDEMEYVKNVTGLLPAIRGIDFIHERDNEKETNNAINWWKAGGIPTIMWHWGAPSIGEGYENSKKSIDIQQCFIEGTAENKAFTEELKIKADHLERIRDANVPVLWRPFHELNGDWFWWSKQGPEMFKKLWIYMFNYFVNERKLNNLIWVLCYTDNPDIKWYPGDEYVDIIGADTYNGGSDSQIRMFNKLREINGDKSLPVAYHECGTIPDPEKCLKNGAMWSWWMEWHTTFVNEMEQKYLNYVYNHKLVITLNEIPDIVKEFGENKVENQVLEGRIIPFTELKSYNIGPESKSGSLNITDEKLEMTATGTDFRENKDEGFFAFSQIEGDFDISVQVIGLDSVNLYSKAGIMARADLSGGSKHVFFNVFTDNRTKKSDKGGCGFQYRENKSKETKTVYPDPELAGSNFDVNYPDSWIRLTREGDFFRSYISSDNKTWHLYSRQKLIMPLKLLVGLAISSNDPGKITTVKFSGFQMNWK